jgi:hypothetical protein
LLQAASLRLRLFYRYDSIKWQAVAPKSTPWDSLQLQVLVVADPLGPWGIVIVSFAGACSALVGEAGKVGYA